MNINELMEKSKKTPWDEICRKCHLDEEALKIDKHKDIDKKDLFNCLACHEGHNDCAGCHH